MLYGCEDVKALKWMTGSDIIWMKRKYGLTKGCCQNEWNFKVEILAWEAKGACISASIAMAEAIDWAGGSNRQLPQTSLFYNDLFQRLLLRQLFHKCFRQWEHFNQGILYVAMTRLVGLVPTFIKPCSRDSRNVVATCPTTSNFEKSVLLLCEFIAYYIQLIQWSINMFWEICQ